jgi:hypothetical protein
LPKHAGAYKSTKRRKELSRLKKQEEKRQRRLKKTDNDEQDIEIVIPEDEDKELIKE